MTRNETNSTETSYLTCQWKMKAQKKRKPPCMFSAVLHFRIETRAKQFRFHTSCLKNRLESWVMDVVRSQTTRRFAWNANAHVNAAAYIGFFILEEWIHLWLCKWRKLFYNYRVFLVKCLYILILFFSLKIRFVDLFVETVNIIRLWYQFESIPPDLFVIRVG